MRTQVRMMRLIIVIHQAQSGFFASLYLADMAHSPFDGRIHMPCADVVLKFTIFIHLSQKRLPHYSESPLAQIHLHPSCQRELNKIQDLD